MRPSIVLDTNVLIAGLRSRNGASFRLLSLIGESAFELNVSVPLVLEYEEVAKRESRALGLTHAEIDDVLDFVCAVATHREIYFLWRPVLRDAADDMVLEVAVEAACDIVVTHNVRDFVGAERFGIRILTPGEFLKTIGVNP